ncbi:MAG TPA: hypothetical protein VHF89_19910 [Solirubrobacteraceae bacterium]|nr:hypothetical protein [Solirubrobacteraceae bacterium]
MTALRLIPLPIHAALEMLAGLTIGAAPFALGLSTPAAFAGVVIGVLLVGLSLQSLDAAGTGSIHVGAHLAADQGLALGLAIAAAVMASIGDDVAAALFAGAGIVQLALIAVTHYTSR